MSQILIYPNINLRQVSIPVPNYNEWVDGLARDHFERSVKSAYEAMVNAGGAGISGIQIGVPYRFFWMKDDQGRFECAINPSYKIVEGDTSRFVREGCLSFPDAKGNVRRYARIRATYERAFKDSSSTVKCWGVELTGLKAHVFQHELEHLDGKLFIDSMFPSERDAVIRQLRPQTPVES